jgi:hypothetical protein
MVKDTRGSTNGGPCTLLRVQHDAMMDQPLYIAAHIACNSWHMVARSPCCAMSFACNQLDVLDRHVPSHRLRLLHVTGE